MTRELIMNYQIDIRNFKSFPSFKARFLSYFPENYQDESMVNFCWNWQGSCRGNYGVTCYGQKMYSASRMSYITFNGPVQADQLVRHTCDNPRCVNPRHLLLGDDASNAIDAVKRNRQGHQKLNEECVKVIKWMLKYKPAKGLVKKLASLHKVSPATIYDIKAGKTWGWLQISN